MQWPDHIPKQPQTPSDHPVDSFHWTSLAQAVLADSRPLNDWERTSLNEFVWAELNTQHQGNAVASSDLME
jgi:hypothetical protein